jgi:hypothetical protein
MSLLTATKSGHVVWRDASKLLCCVEAVSDTKRAQRRMGYGAAAAGHFSSLFADRKEVNE